MENVMTNRDDEIVIDLREVAMLLLSKIWLIIVCTVVAGAAGLLFSALALTPQYESTTSIYILNKASDNAMTYSDTQLATQLTKDYEKLIIRRYVLEVVIEELGLDVDYEELLEQVSVKNVTDTRIIEVTVKDANPKNAQIIADSIREVAAKYIKDVTDVEAVNVVDKANLPTDPSEPSVLMWTAVAAMLGLIGCAGVLIVAYLMDDTIKTADDVAKYLGLGTLASIPSTETEANAKKKKKKLGLNMKTVAKVEKKQSTPTEPEKTATDKDIVEL